MHEIYELASNQEETATRVVLYLKFAASMGYKSAVVRTPDTDILVILLHHAPSIPMTVYQSTWASWSRPRDLITLHRCLAFMSSPTRM